MRYRRSTIFGAIALALTACDPVPSGRITLSPEPASRPLATDTVEVIVARVLAQHGLSRQSASCQRSGAWYTGEVLDSFPHGAARVTLRACLTTTRRGAEVHFTAGGAGIGFGLPPRSQAILAAVADSLRPFAGVRVGRR